MTWRVIRIIREPVSNKRHETTAAAGVEMDRLSAAHPDRSYSITHESFPLDDDDRTHIVLCWVPGTWPEDSTPGQILGPYAEAEARTVASTLTCENEVRKLDTRIPEWTMIGRDP